MKADDIRRVYLEYMTETGHVVIPVSYTHLTLPTN